MQCMYCKISCFFNQMQGNTVSEESRMKMLEILQRVKSGESVMEAEEEEPLDSDDEADEDLSVRMAGYTQLDFVLK